MICAVCLTEFSARPCECGSPSTALHDRACPARQTCVYTWCAGSGVYDAPAIQPLTESEREGLRGYAVSGYAVSGFDVLRLLAERDSVRLGVTSALDREREVASGVEGASLAVERCRRAVLAAMGPVQADHPSDSPLGQDERNAFMAKARLNGPFAEKIAEGLLAARDDMSAMEARVAELRRAWDATGQADAGWCRESAVAGGDLFGSSAAYAKAWRDLVEAVNSICRAVEGPQGGTTP